MIGWSHLNYGIKDFEFEFISVTVYWPVWYIKVCCVGSLPLVCCNAKLVLLMPCYRALYPPHWPFLAHHRIPGWWHQDTIKILDAKCGQSDSLSVIITNRINLFLYFMVTVVIYTMVWTIFYKIILLCNVYFVYFAWCYCWSLDCKMSHGAVSSGRPGLWTDICIFLYSGESHVRQLRGGHGLCHEIYGTWVIISGVKVFKLRIPFSYSRCGFLSGFVQWFI